MDTAFTHEGSFLNRVTCHLEDHLMDEDFGVLELAREVGLSRSQLHRRIRRLSGKSPSQYIREYRLEKARELLKHEELTAAEIAYRVGFRSPTYFNTCFHDHFGLPPGEARHREDVVEAPVKNEVQRAVRGQQPLFPWIIGGAALILIGLFSWALFYGVGTTQHPSVEPPGNVLPPARRTIAVLPIRNWSGNPELEYISDGLTDAVISRVALLQDIDRVVPYASITQYKESAKDLGSIAGELDVDHILQGNFQLAAETVHINFQLVHIPSNTYLWSEQYTDIWNADNIFEMQVEVAETIAQLMEIELEAVEISEISSFPTQNRQAYHNYLQAEYWREKNDPLALEKAIDLYETAIALDPEFLQAYNGLADTYLTGGIFWGTMERNTAWEEAESLLQRALAKDSTNARTHEQLFAGYFYYTWDFERVEEYYHGHHKQMEQALTRSLAAIDYAIRTGKADEALLDIHMNLHDDPADRHQYLLKAEALYSLGQEAKAAQVLDTFQDFFSDDLQLLLGSAELYYRLGDLARCREQLLISEDRFNNRPPSMLWLQAMLNYREGRQQAVSGYLFEIEQRYRAGTSGSPAWYLALYHAETGSPADALHWLDRSYQAGEVEMTGLRQEPLLETLRTLPEFQRIYTAMGFHHYD